MNTHKNFKVLYVDNNEDSCFMLSTLMAYSNVDVTSVPSCEEALRTARCTRFDLFLLASRFDVGNGFDLCRDLHLFSPKTPIVFYTGDALEVDRLKGIAAGANAYVIKPHSDAIESVIMSFLNNSVQTAHH